MTGPRSEQLLPGPVLLVRRTVVIVCYEHFDLAVAPQMTAATLLSIEFDDRGRHPAVTIVGPRANEIAVAVLVLLDGPVHELDLRLAVDEC